MRGRWRGRQCRREERWRRWPRKRRWRRLEASLWDRRKWRRRRRRWSKGWIGRTSPNAKLQQRREAVAHGGVAGRATPQKWDRPLSLGRTECIHRLHHDRNAHTRSQSPTRSRMYRNLVYAAPHVHRVGKPVAAARNHTARRAPLRVDCSTLVLNLELDARPLVCRLALAVVELHGHHQVAQRASVKAPTFD